MLNSHGQQHMTALSSFFLRAKHWQLFLLLFVVPMVLETTAAAYVPETIRSWKDLIPGGFVYLGLGFIATLCVFVWLWAMSSFLNSIQEPDVKLNLSFFRVALIYVPVYLLVFMAAVFSEPPAAIIVPLHLFATFCIFYMFYFVAKSLVTVNKGRQVSLGEYAKPLILLCLFPIGVWSIQPRINQLWAQHGKQIEVSRRSGPD